MTLPKKLLYNVAWSCGRTRFPDLDAFASNVQTYQDDIMGDSSSWAPNEILVSAPTVNVSFYAWSKDGESQDQVVLTLTPADGESFTQLEFFHQLNDQIGAQLIDRDLYLYDHCFFEGLTLSEDGTTYHIYFGS